MKSKSEDISQSMQMISSDMDLKIFVDANKSQNSFLTKEEFQPYETAKVDTL